MRWEPIEDPASSIQHRFNHFGAGVGTNFWKRGSDPMFDEQLGVAHDVDEQHVRDLETKMGFKLRGH
jgi:hypothetical protein